MLDDYKIEAKIYRRFPTMVFEAEIKAFYEPSAEFRDRKFSKVALSTLTQRLRPR